MDTLTGVNDIRESGKELSVFVDKVLAATGASSVDILGHDSGVLVTMHVFPCFVSQLLFLPRTEYQSH